MNAEAPYLEACGECWSPITDGVRSCDCDGERLRWQVTFAWLCVAHPALAAPLAGRFRYPVTSDKLATAFIARHRRALRRVFAVDPDARGCQWWVELDPRPGDAPVERLPS